jgi:hypothetical protein
VIGLWEYDDSRLDDDNTVGNIAFQYFAGGDDNNLLLAYEEGKKKKKVFFLWHIIGTFRLVLISK